MAAVAALSAATWLYGGYRYGNWPQPGFLAGVLRYSGKLDGDWFTSFPPGHWAIDHLLALLPSSLLELGVGALWVAFVVVLWASFISICESFGTKMHTAVAAGLVLIPTAIGGFGASEVLFNFFYPNGLAFAFGLASLALLLRDRNAWAGAALGLSMLAHPGLGPLLFLTFAPLLLYRQWGDWRQLLRFVVPAAVLGLPAVIQVLASTQGGSLSPHEQYEFLAIVRTPHHYLYRDFSPDEYWRTGLWTLVLAASLLVTRATKASRSVAIIAVAIIAICATGAIASQNGWPLILVTVQTSRLSGLVVLLGVAAAAGALSKLVGPIWATASLLVCFLIAPALYPHVGHWFSSGEFVFSLANYNGTEAMVVLVALAGAAIAHSLQASGRLRRLPHTVRTQVAPAFAAALFLVAAISLAVKHDVRVSPSSPDDLALKRVSRVARENTSPGQLVLGSPTLDGLRVFAERPDVVEFGSVRLGEGDDEWRQRVFDLTGDPHILDPEPIGTDVVGRTMLMEQRYQAHIQASREPICKYHAAVVIVRPVTDPPPWLHRIYANEFYELLGVRPDTCQPPPPAAAARRE